MCSSCSEWKRTSGTEFLFEKTFRVSVFPSLKWGGDTTDVVIINLMKLIRFPSKLLEEFVQELTARSRYSLMGLKTASVDSQGDAANRRCSRCLSGGSWVLQDVQETPEGRPSSLWPLQPSACLTLTGREPRRARASGPTAAPGGGASRGALGPRNASLPYYKLRSGQIARVPDSQLRKRWLLRGITKSHNPPGKGQMELGIRHWLKKTFIYILLLIEVLSPTQKNINCGHKQQDNGTLLPVGKSRSYIMWYFLAIFDENYRCAQISTGNILKSKLTQFFYGVIITSDHSKYALNTVTEMQNIKSKQSSTAERSLAGGGTGGN
ncbi:hypothetical protein MG293_008107 [Ovis ammon polii]|uniref:Uncharacterized protein n=1 Tax=Ovis ammon polii TaxID=230172 RepID=A0AAD4UCD3_OVIAM|nr:hypothetical protein MG293_008107 [Ovis ammon polii]